MKKHELIFEKFDDLRQSDALRTTSDWLNAQFNQFHVEIRASDVADFMNCGKRKWRWTWKSEKKLIPSDLLDFGTFYMKKYVLVDSEEYDH